MALCHSREIISFPQNLEALEAFKKNFKENVQATLLEAAITTSDFLLGVSNFFFVNFRAIIRLEVAMKNLDHSIPVRKSLSADALIATVYHEFRKIQDPRQFSKRKPASISFVDVFMSDLSVFGLKFPSLLQYDQYRKILDENLKALYRVEQFPSDTYLRERLDDLDPKQIRPVFKKIFSEVQRGKCLEEFEFLDGRYLLVLDGTGEFSSSTICCAQCCKKEHQNGSVIYYHQMLGACIVHPDRSKR